MLLENLVIGSRLSELVYALVTDSFFISTREDPPMFYRKLSIPVLNCRVESEAWPKTAFFMSLMGKFITTDKGSKVRVTKHSVSFTKNNRSEKIDFKKCVIFDTTNIQTDAPVLEAREPHFMVIDDLELSGLGGKYKSLPSFDNSNLNFARRIEFYCSPRVDGALFITDCVVESLLTRSQMGEFSNSDTMARFVVEKHLKSSGVTGRLEKIYKNGKPKYRSPKIKNVKRFIYTRDRTLYQDTESLIFKNLSLREVFSEQRT